METMCACRSVSAVRDRRSRQHFTTWMPLPSVPYRVYAGGIFLLEEPCRKSSAEFPAESPLLGFPCRVSHPEVSLLWLPCQRFHAVFSLPSVPCRGFSAGSLMPGVPCRSSHAGVSLPGGPRVPNAEVALPCILIRVSLTETLCRLSLWVLCRVSGNFCCSSPAVVPMLGFHCGGPMPAIL